MGARRYERETRNSISTSSHVLFCLLNKRTNDDFLTVFRRFPNTFRRILEILRKLFEGQTVVSGHNFPKISEYFRGRTDDVSIIQEHI